MKLDNRMIKIEKVSKVLTIDIRGNKSALRCAPNDINLIE